MAHWGTSKRSNVWLGLVLFISLVLGASAAQGSLIFELSIEYNSGTRPEGTPPWLTATFEDSGTDEVTLTLNTTTLTDAECVKEWMFNLDPTYDPANLLFSGPIKTGSFADPLISTDSDNGTPPDLKADGDGFFDILIEFSIKDAAPQRFGAGDRAVYTISGISDLTADSFDFISAPDGGQGEYKTVAQVLSIGPNYDKSGWVTVPEPATIVLMGLGILALLRKRKA